MTSNRRLMLKMAAAFPLVAAGAASRAQQYPSKTIKIIVPAGAGSGIDAVARFFTDPLAKRLGQAVIVENRPGAGGLIGYTQAAKAAPDGHTIILTGIPLYLLPHLSEVSPPPFDPQKDFAPIARVARLPQAIIVPADSPYKTLGDLVEAMRRKPDDITYSSQGVGSSAHLCGVVLNNLSHTKARHIPYKETGVAITDVVGGRISFTCQSSTAILPLIQAGKVRALGVTNSRRWESLPNVPTIAEAGVAGFNVASQLDFMAPAGTPDSILQILSKAFTEIAQRPDYKTFCAKQLIVPEVASANELPADIARETVRWKQIVEMARS
jgi:tripartite-type tricarboxylate transporter receptor subunit TctC